MSRVVSHYQLEDEIGRGGMGVVYRATDLRLDRPVAIKMLHAAATADPDRLIKEVLDWLDKYLGPVRTR